MVARFHLGIRVCHSVSNDRATFMFDLSGTSVFFRGLVTKKIIQNDKQRMQTSQRLDSQHEMKSYRDQKLKTLSSHHC